MKWQSNRVDSLTAFIHPSSHLYSLTWSSFATWSASLVSSWMTICLLLSLQCPMGLVVSLSRVDSTFTPTNDCSLSVPFASLKVLYFSLDWQDTASSSNSRRTSLSKKWCTFSSENSSLRRKSKGKEKFSGGSFSWGLYVVLHTSLFCMFLWFHWTRMRNKPNDFSSDIDSILSIIAFSRKWWLRAFVSCFDPLFPLCKRNLEMEIVNGL